MFDEQYNYLMEETVSGTEVNGYYTKDEIDTTSGVLQTNIDAKPDTFLELTDTPSTYDNSKYLQSTAAGTFWAYVAGIAGPKGEDGGEWMGGYGAPTASTGTLDNFYLDYNTGDIYKKETTVTGTQYGVMIAREADGSYTFADAVRFVKTGQEVIVDNVDDEASFTGTWNTYNTANAYDGNCRYATSDYTAQANFKFIVPDNGDYDVYAYWPALGAAATNVPFMITHASGTTTIRKSQAINGSTWNYLSTHEFDGAATWVWKMNIQGSTTFSGLSDTPATYDNGKYLRSTAVGTEWYDLNDDYYTETEVDTISGALHSEINIHVSNTSNPHSVTLEQARVAGNIISSNNAIYFRDTNSRIYSNTANELTLSATNEVVIERDLHVDRDLYVDNRFTIDGGATVNIIRDEDDFGHDDPNALVTQQSAKAYVDNSIITFSGSIDHNTILNTHNLTTDIDHDQLTNFLISEHFTEASIDHANIQNIGTNTHAQIDTHISNVSNPHTVTLEQARTAGNIMTGGIVFNPPANMTCIDISAANRDLVWMLGHNTSGYGYYWQYTGTGVGDANYLYLYSENGAGADFYHFRYHQTTHVIDVGSRLNLESTYAVQFRDSAIYINSNDDGHLDLDADISIDLNADTDLSNNNLNNVQRVSFEQRVADPTTPAVDDGDVWYRDDVENFIGRANTFTHEVQLVQIIQCYNSTMTGLNVTTPVAVPWNNEDFKDSLFTHSTAVNNTRVEVERDGIYEISYSISLDNASSSRNTIRTRVRVNGATYINRGTATSYSRNTTDDKQTNSMTFVWQLNANDYIEIMGDRQGSSGGGNTMTNESHIYIKLIRYV